MSDPQAVPELQALNAFTDDLDAIIQRGPDPQEHEGCDITPAQPDVVAERLAALELQASMAGAPGERSAARDLGAASDLEKRLAALEAWVGREESKRSRKTR